MADARIRAPELPDTLQWVNTDGPVRLADLRGKIVILDFWTSGCINCMHTMEDLRYLENKYKDNLIIISIHSPKFPHDKEIENVIKAVNRFHIKHPVAHDPIMRVWTKYIIKAWPSAVFIDTEGYVVGSMRGEGRRRQLDQLIQQYVDIAEKRDGLDLSQIAVRFKREADNVVKFPGKIHAAESHVYVSDSGHNRVIEINHYGRVTRVFGSGAAGLLDGYGTEAAFNNPQGLALINDFLYVADTGNHAIRRINIKNNETLTLAGNGKLQRHTERYFHDALSTSLNSPWDLSYLDGELYIAMAGSHQIWKMDLTELTLQIFSGTGQENLMNGNADIAAFAQPSGLATGDQCVYVVDAESSSVRSVRLPDGRVTTLVGTGLFAFGDADGGWSSALLQHPLGVHYDASNETLYVADTYNGKIKLMDMRSKGISTIDVGRSLSEPGGISIQGNTLWIANTNSHEIGKFNLLSHEFEVLELNEPERDF